MARGHAHAPHAHAPRADGAPAPRGGDSRANQRRLATALALAAGYMVAEAVGGWLSGSLALLADATHMLADVAALALSLFALWIARRPATPRHTYGYYRTEILAALVNGAALLALTALLVGEALGRLADPPEVRGGLLLVVATGGLAVNVAALWVLRGGHDSLNVRAAWLHVMADALGSVAALAAGALVMLFGWSVADPVATLVIAALVVRSAWHLLRETVAVLMEGAPGHVDVDRVRSAIAGVPGVHAVHDLHVWTITSGMVSMSCHVVWTGEASTEAALARIHDLVRHDFAIDHVTIQVEPRDFEEKGPCA